MPHEKDKELIKHSKKYQYVEDNHIFKVDGATLRYLLSSFF